MENCIIKHTNNCSCVCEPNGKNQLKNNAKTQFKIIINKKETKKKVP